MKPACLFLFVLCLGFSSAAIGQSEAPPAEAAPTERSPLVRVWTLVPGELPPVEFGAFPKFKGSLAVAAEGADGSNRQIVATLKPFMLGGFQPLKEGSIRLKLERQVGESRVVEAEMPLTVRRGARHTVIVTKSPSGSLAISELPDSDNRTNAGPTKTSKQIRFFCSIPDAEIALNIPELRFQRKLRSGETAEIGNVPPSIVNVMVSGTSGDKPFQGESEIDFTVEEAVSWLLIHDRYGRIVPVVTSDVALE